MGLLHLLPPATDTTPKVTVLPGSAPLCLRLLQTPVVVVVE